MPTTTHTTEPHAARAVTDRLIEGTGGVHVGPEAEGLRHLRTDDGTRLVPRDAVSERHPAVLGAQHAATHPRGLGRLAALLDHGAHNTGTDDLVPFTFFGHDIEPHVPRTRRGRADGAAA